jgi:hypothetical protein
MSLKGVPKSLLIKYTEPSMRQRNQEITEVSHMESTAVQSWEGAYTGSQRCTYAFSHLLLI